MVNNPWLTSIAVWALLSLGGRAAVVFVGGELVSLPHPGLDIYLSNLPIVPTSLVAAFLYWRRPMHPVARRVLVFAASPVTGLALGRLLSPLSPSFGPRACYPLDR